MADVTMPQLGETVTEGTITKWFKQVGDEVKLDEPLFEVSTDKVDTEVPSPVAGMLTEIKAHEGDTVAGRRGDRRRRRRRRRPPAARGGAGRRRGAGGRGRRGDRRPAARPPADGRAGAAERSAAGLRPSPPPRPPPRRRVRRRPRPPPAAAAPSPAAGAVGGDSRLLSPVVRRLVNEHGLDPAQITGTGAGGRITREDVAQPHRAAGGPAAPAAAPAPRRRARAGRRSGGRRAGRPPLRRPRLRARAGAGRRRPAAAPRRRGPRPASATRRCRLSKIRKLTGDHMLMSLAVTPHAFSVVEVDYANVDARPQRGEGRVEGQPRASASRTCRSSAGPSSTPSPSSRT